MLQYISALIRSAASNLSHFTLAKTFSSPL